jgi:hypothetical protein
MSWEDDVQRAAEERLAACNERLWAEEEGDVDVEHDGPYPAVAPYCGCDTCVVREVLDAAWPIMLRAAREELTCS